MFSCFEWIEISDPNFGYLDAIDGGITLMWVVHLVVENEQKLYGIWIISYNQDVDICSEYVCHDNLSCDFTNIL